MVELRYLCKAVHKVGNFGSEVLLDLLGRGAGILDDIVKEASCNTCRIEIEISKYICNFKRMNKIRFAGLPGLSAMLLCRKQISPPQQFFIRVGMVLSELFDYRLEPNHCWL